MFLIKINSDEWLDIGLPDETVSYIFIKQVVIKGLTGKEVEKGPVPQEIREMILQRIGKREISNNLGRVVVREDYAKCLNHPESRIY